MNIMILDKKDITVATDSSSIYAINKKLPFRLIDAMIISSSVNTTTADLLKIASNNIAIILLSSNYRQSALIASTQSKNAELKLSQYLSTQTSARLMIAKWILTQKIQTHIEHLQRHNIEVASKPWMKKIESCSDLDSLLGIEGSFSKLYFGHYFGLFPKNLHKAKRSKRPPLDPLNAMMSFFYTLFYNLITVRLVSFGFEPGIGYLHRPFRDHNALASDILEIFRARINAFVYDVFVTQELIAASDFTKKGGVYLRYAGRKKLWHPFRDLYGSCEVDLDKVITELRKKM